MQSGHAVGLLHNISFCSCRSGNSPEVDPGSPPLFWGAGVGLDPSKKDANGGKGLARAGEIKLLNGFATLLHSYVCFFFKVKPLPWVWLPTSFKSSERRSVKTGAGVFAEQKAFSR